MRAVALSTRLNSFASLVLRRTLAIWAFDDVRGSQASWTEHLGQAQAGSSCVVPHSVRPHWARGSRRLLFGGQKIANVDASLTMNRTEGALMPCLQCGVAP